MRIGIRVPDDESVARNVIAAAVQAKRLLSVDVSLVLIGDVAKAKHLLTCEGAIASTFDYLLSQQTESIDFDIRLLEKKEIDSLITLSNGIPAAHLFTRLTLANVQRPALAALIPQMSGAKSLLLDVAFNPDCTAEQLLQFAQLGKQFSQRFMDVENPRIALMNIGEEEEKGNLLTQKAHSLLRTLSCNFIGNVEGRDVFTDKADVMVCEGFMGDIILKLTESLYHLTKIKKCNDQFFEKLNLSKEGLRVVLGLRNEIFLYKNETSIDTIKNMVLGAKKMYASRTVAEAFSA